MPMKLLPTPCQPVYMNRDRRADNEKGTFRPDKDRKTDGQRDIYEQKVSRRRSRSRSPERTSSSASRWDDPMNQFSEKLKAEKSSSKPKHRAPPNRFNILPGRQWDGIDRSNGFEVAYFKKLAGQAVKKDMDYKYTVADM